MNKSLLMATVAVVLFGAAHMARYEFISTIHPNASVVRLDRWTGDIVACDVSDTFHPVKCEVTP